MLETVFSKFCKTHNTSIAINMKPKRTSWGGGNQFVNLLASFLKRRGFDVTYEITSKTKIAIIIDPRTNLDSIQFGEKELQHAKQKQNIKVIHRVNECDKRKESVFMDKILKEVNSVADHTIFISEWLKDYFKCDWNLSENYSVIPNAADSKIFYPQYDCLHKKNKAFTIVTHHWSNNWMKGFKHYQLLDKYIDDGKLPDTNFIIIGRWPEDIKWKSAITIPPCNGTKLANILRTCNLYITGSLWEPCGMHHIEGAQCGLPLLYHQDGGGIVEFGKKYGVSFNDQNLLDQILYAQKNIKTLKKKVIENKTDGELMCIEYLKVIEKILLL